jgi:hypothetical protein
LYTWSLSTWFMICLVVFELHNMPFINFFQRHQTFILFFFLFSSSLNTLKQFHSCFCWKKHNERSSISLLWAQFSSQKLAKFQTFFLMEIHSQSSWVDEWKSLYSHLENERVLKKHTTANYLPISTNDCLSLFMSPFLHLRRATQLCRTNSSWRWHERMFKVFKWP